MVVTDKSISRRLVLFRNILLGMLLLTLLSACIMPAAYRPEDKTYRLAPQLGEIQRHSLANLFVPKVQVSPALDTQRIALFKPGLQQGFLAYGHWPDRLSTYFYATVLESLSRSNAFLAVSDRPSSNKKEYKLLLRLSAFHAESPATPQGKVAVVLGMEALLVRAKDQRIIGKYRYDVRKENIVVNTGGIVDALNQALGETLTSLIRDMGKDLPVFF